jgi:hypothetical protein
MDFQLPIFYNSVTKLRKQESYGIKILKMIKFKTLDKARLNLAAEKLATIQIWRTVLTEALYILYIFIHRPICNEKILSYYMDM